MSFDDIKTESADDGGYQECDILQYDPFSVINYEDTMEISAADEAASSIRTQQLEAAAESTVQQSGKHSLLLQQLRPDPQSDEVSKQALARLMAQVGGVHSYFYYILTS